MLLLLELKKLSNGGKVSDEQNQNVNNSFYKMHKLYELVVNKKKFDDKYQSDHI